MSISLDFFFDAPEFFLGSAACAPDIAPKMIIAAIRQDNFDRIETSAPKILGGATSQLLSVQHPHLQAPFHDGASNDMLLALMSNPPLPDASSSQLALILIDFLWIGRKKDAGRTSHPAARRLTTPRAAIPQVAGRLACEH
ncbi:MAG TPA: hypothetical protein VFH68_00180 [Polyangia bacterium]|nr:hypothetical protein [Polyangia bacterium]